MTRFGLLGSAVVGTACILFLGAGCTKDNEPSETSSTPAHATSQTPEKTVDTPPAVTQSTQVNNTTSEKPVDPSTEAETASGLKRWPARLTAPDHVIGQTGWLKGVIGILPSAIKRIPPNRVIDMSQFPDCESLWAGDTPPPANELYVTPDPKLVVEKNYKLPNVFAQVSPAELEAYKIPPIPDAAVFVEHERCLLQPRVFGIRAGQDLRLLNGDNVKHQLSIAGDNPTTVELPNFDADGVLKEEWFKGPQLGVPLKCEIHPWEFAYACVTNHPAYGVSNEKGQIYIPNVPKGKFTVELWLPPVPGLDPIPPIEVNVRSTDGAATLFWHYVE
ncbi:MAG: hypothetical protein MK538_03810 [Planctomycetes bacterium]|nr:hypothetical protein [Planctomycetota bacterium]